jgi:site-specific recombinase XerD
MKKSIETLCAEVLSALKDAGYTDGGIRKHEATYRLLLDFATEKQEDCYCEQLGRKFVTDRYNAVWDGKRGNNTYQANERIVHLEKLWHYQQYGTILFSARSGKKPPFICPVAFEREYEAFSNYCNNRDYSLDSRRTALYIVRKFLLFLDAQEVTMLDTASVSIIESFIGIYADCSASHIKNIVSRLSIFFKFMYSSGATSEDKSIFLQKLRYVREAFLPSSMPKSEIDKILKAVDTSNSIGKRDYALLLLVVRLGLRSMDIHNIQLGDFDCKNRLLRITQSKTKEEIVLPLPDDVGWAVIDYLRNGRPKTEFVNLLYAIHRKAELFL